MTVALSSADVISILIVTSGAPKLGEAWTSLSACFQAVRTSAPVSCLRLTSPAQNLANRCSSAGLRLPSASETIAKARAQASSRVETVMSYGPRSFEFRFGREQVRHITRDSVGEMRVTLFLERLNAFLHVGRRATR